MTDCDTLHASIPSFAAGIACCKSMQIVCDALNPPHVTSLAIVGPRYNGTIPISLDKLSALSNLTIQNTYFRGVIPTQFGSLVNLKVLQIKNNSLISGGVPTELALLNNLEVLDLSGNNLIGTFPEIIEVACKNLVYLDISGNENLVDIDTLTIYNTLSYILFVVTFLILAALYLFIYLCEIRDVQRKRLNWAKARTTFNITLTIMSLSVMAAASAQLATSIKDISAQASIENVLQLAFKATFTHCYILYAYNRTHKILNSVSVVLQQCVYWFVVLCPLVLYLQVIPMVLLYVRIMNGTVFSLLGIFPNLATGCAAVFDFMLLGLFAYCIRKNTLGNKIEGKFLVVIRYGTCASILCVSGLSTLAITAKGVFWYRAKAFISLYLCMGVLAVLVGMKIALYVFARNEERLMSLEKEAAIEVVEGRTTTENGDSSKSIGVGKGSLWNTLTAAGKGQSTRTTQLFVEDLNDFSDQSN